MLGLEILLKETGISRKEIAKKLGVNQNNISMWIKVKRIPKKHLSFLASIFNSDETYINSIIETASLELITKEIQMRDNVKNKENLENRLHILEQDKALLQMTISQLTDEVEALKYCQDSEFIDKLKESFDKTLITLSKENRSLNNIICSLRKENNVLKRENKNLHKELTTK